MWTDTKKWWMDIIKSMLTFGFITLVTLTYIGQLESEKQFRQYLAQSKYQENKSIAAKHQSATNTYLSTAHDAYTDHRQGKDRESSTTIKSFQDEIYDNYRLTLALIRDIFPDSESISEKINSIYEHNAALYSSYKEKEYDKFIEHHRKLKELNNNLHTIFDTAIEKQLQKQLTSS